MAMIRRLTLVTLFSLAAAQSAVGQAVDGFDFPVGKPDSTSWYVAQDFGAYYSSEKYHLGEDWNLASGDLNAPVYAAANGTVRYAKDAGTGWNGVIIVDHKAAAGAPFDL